MLRCFFSFSKFLSDRNKLVIPQYSGGFFTFQIFYLIKINFSLPSAQFFFLLNFFLLIPQYSGVFLFSNFYVIKNNFFQFLKFQFSIFFSLPGAEEVRGDHPGASLWRHLWPGPHWEGRNPGPGEFTKIEIFYLQKLAFLSLQILGICSCSGLGPSSLFLVRNSLSFGYFGGFWGILFGFLGIILVLSPELEAWCALVFFFFIF